MSVAFDNNEDEALPGSLRAVVPLPLGGVVMTMGFPGLDPNQSDGVDGDACVKTLRAARRYGADELVVVVERHEVSTAAWDKVKATCEAEGLKLLHQPITDFSVPGKAVMAWWHASSAARAAAVARGGGLAFSCHHGAGRSGTMACLTLIERGMSAEDALSLIRSHYPPSVERVAQEEFLREQAIG